MQHNRKIIYLLGFLFSLPVALAAYINSSFIASFVGEKSVGIVYALGSMASIFGLLIAPGILRKLGGYKFLVLITFLNSLSFLGFVLARSAVDAVILLVLVISFNTLIIFLLDEILKIFSNNSATGKIRGLYMGICSLAWILSELSFGTIFGGFSFKQIYILGFLFMSLLCLVSLFSLKNIPDPKYDKKEILKYMREFFQNKNLFRSFKITFLLQFFYCWMVIYTPIYLFTHLGFTWREIGVIFTIMLLPFGLIPFRLGKYMDKFGERKILMSGFIIASFATLSLFFIQTHDMWLWAILLFTTRVGAATIEVGSDAYFFKHIKSENEELVGVYRTASPISYIVGPLLASLVLIFVPNFNFIFPILGAVMLAGVYLSSTIARSDI